MRIEPNDRADGLITLLREPGEKRVKNESDLFYRLKITLQDLGEDVIKKEMVKDGHLISDHVYYVRSRKTKAKGAYAIYDSQYALRNIAAVYNGAGRVELEFFGLGPSDSRRNPPGFLSHPYGHGVFEGSEIRKRD